MEPCTQLLTGVNALALPRPYSSMNKQPTQSISEVNCRTRIRHTTTYQHCPHYRVPCVARVTVVQFLRIINV
jgi:hypothetical protein